MHFLKGTLILILSTVTLVTAYSDTGRNIYAREGYLYPDIGGSIYVREAYAYAEPTYRNFKRTTPQDRLNDQVKAQIAEHEKQLHAERVKAALAAAKKSQTKKTKG